MNLDGEVDRQLGRFAELEGRSKSEVVRGLICEWLDRKRERELLAMTTIPGGNDG